ncbi:MAG: TAXI family TRAP transporter solute-binding subunit [Woeseiaceae bacterium]
MTTYRRKLATLATRLGIVVPIIFLLVMIAGCERGPVELTLAKPASEIDRDVADSLATLFARESRIHFNLTEEEMSEEAAIEALVAGTVDVALISNSMPYRDGITTVIPLYPTVLHIGQTGKTERQEFNDFADLIRGSAVFAGPEGSASRVMFEQSVKRLNLQEDEFSYVENRQRPDVVVVFVPVQRNSRRGISSLRLISMGPPDSVGKGSIVDSATLLNPYLRPFIIPTGTYGDATVEPILTLAVDKMLVAKRDLESSAVYDLVNELVRFRPALSAQNPGLFQNLTGEFDASRSTFVLHPGAQAYLQRDAPSVYERYSGIAEVGVTVLIALISAGYGGLKLLRIRRKNRIDTFYSQTIKLRNSVTGETTNDERRDIVVKVRDLQNKAFEMLVDEKLAANESFRIFITLSNDVLQELGEEH